jgi:hypothetical protein
MLLKLAIFFISGGFYNREKNYCVELLGRGDNQIRPAVCGMGERFMLEPNSDYQKKETE